MKLELQSAANFLVHLIKLGKGNVNENQLEKFKLALVEVLRRRYCDHWFPEKPFKGTGYRCIRINNKMDPVIAQGSESCGLSAALVHSTFPSELTMWIDPLEVTYRIGENGSICILYEYKKGLNEPWKANISNNTTKSKKNLKSKVLGGSATLNSVSTTGSGSHPLQTINIMNVTTTVPCKDSLRKMDNILDPRKPNY